MPTRPLPPTEYTSCGRCLGCAARRGEPCDLLCAYRTGYFDVPEVLRRVGLHFHEHRAGVGYDLPAALAAAARHLVGPRAAADLARRAREVLTEHLVDQGGRRDPQVVRAALLTHGLHTPPDQLRAALFTAARDYDGQPIGLPHIAGCS